MLHKHVSMSPYYLLSALRSQISPPLSPYPVGVERENAIGIYANLSEELLLHFLRLLRFDGDFLEQVDSNCCLKVLGGLDCAGDEREYQQRSQLSLDTSHVENGSYVLASIHVVTPQPENTVVETDFYGFEEFDIEEATERKAKLDTLIHHLEVETETCRKEFFGMVDIEVFIDVLEESREVLDSGDVPTPKSQPLLSSLPQIKKPLGYKHLGEIVYNENSKGSIRASRPWFRIFMRETPETLRPLVSSLMEPQILELTTVENEVNIDAVHDYLTPVRSESGKVVGFEAIEMSSFNDNQKRKLLNMNRSNQISTNLDKPLIIVARPSSLLSVSAFFQLKSADGKLGQDLTMRTGSACFSCDLSLEDLHNPERISQGVSMNVNTSDLAKVFQALAEDHHISEDELDDFVVPSNRGDWEMRLGLKGRPLSEHIEITRVSSVLHCSVLRILTWLNQLVPRDMTIKKWGQGHKFTDNSRLRFDKARKLWMLVLGEVGGYKDKPCPNQITGYLASKFFEGGDYREVVIGHIVKLWRKFNKSEMTDAAKKIYRELLQRLAIIRRVIASDECIIISKFFYYCQDTYLFILKSFPWCLISDSLHRLLAHVWEHIVLNNNFGLASENEQVVECGHRAR